MKVELNQMLRMLSASSTGMFHVEHLSGLQFCCLCVPRGTSCGNLAI